MPATPTPLDHALTALQMSVAEAQPPKSVDDAIAAAINDVCAAIDDAVATTVTTVSATIDDVVARSSPAGAASASRTELRAANERWLAWPLALAASIAMLSFIVRSVPPDTLVAEPAPIAGDAQAFLPVVPLDEIESAGATLVVPARMPRTTLAALGLPIDPARASDAVDAELLVRADGAVLAVRFVF